MFRYSNTVTAIAMFFAAGTAIAQETSTDEVNDDAKGAADRCFYASKSFAIDSPVIIGDSIYLCRAGVQAPKWVKADQPVAANCLYASNYYSPGSVVSQGSTKIAIVCKDDGTWEQLKAGGLQ